MNALQQAQKGVKAASKDIKNSGLGIEEVFKNIQRAAALSVAGFSAQELVKKIALVRGEFQQLEVAFNTMLGSEEKAMALMSQLVETAKKTPFGMSDIASATKQLLAYGLEAEKVNDTLVRLGDIAAGLSIPIGDLAYLYGTTMTQGRLFTQDLRQFMGRGIPIAEELAKQFNVTKDAVGELVTAGKVGFTEVEKAIISMTSSGGKFAGLMEAQSKTITGQISNIEDSIEQMFNTLGKQNEEIIGGTLDVASNVVENWEKVGKAIVDVTIAVGSYKAAMIILTTVEQTMIRFQQEKLLLTKLYRAEALKLAATRGISVAAAYAELGSINALTVAKRMLTGVTKSLNLAMLANPYVAVAAAVGGLVFAIMQLKSEEELVADQTKKYNDEKQKSIELEEERKRKIEELIRVVENASVADDTRREALNKLNMEYPEIFEKYKTEEDALRNIKKIKEEIAKLDAETSFNNVRNELKSVEDRLQAIRDSGHLEMRETLKGKGVIRPYLENLKAEYDALEDIRKNLVKKVQKADNEEFLKDLTGVSNKELERMIKNRENLLAKMALSGKEYGVVEGDAIRGAYNKKEIAGQINIFRQELGKRTQILEDSSKDFRKTAEDSYKKEKNTLDKLIALSSSPDARKKSNIQIGGKSVSGMTMKEYESAIKKQKEIVEEEEKKLNVYRDKQAEKDAAKQEKEDKKREEKEKKQDEKIKKQEEKEDAKRERDLRKERNALNDLLLEYGTYQQKKLAIAEEYADKIKDADSAASYAEAAIERDRREKDLQSESIANKIDWSSVFNDLQGHTKEYLTGLRDQLQSVLSEGVLDVDDMSVLQEKIIIINDELNKQGGLFDFVGEKQREYNRRLEEAAQAQENLTNAKWAEETEEIRNKDIRNQIQGLAGKNVGIFDESLLSQFKEGSNEYKQMAKLLGELTASEVRLGKARENTAKATDKAKEKEDAAKRSAADAVADWFADAQQFIAKKGIDQLPDLLNAVGLGNLGEKAAKGLSAFNNATGAAADYASGNYIGAALKGINAVKDFGSMLGIGGGNAAKVAETMERLTERNEKLTVAIQDLTDEMADASPAEAVSIYRDAIELQAEKERNLLDKAKAQASYSSAHHSWNYYWGGFTQEEIEQGRKRIGKSEWSGDIWDLSPEEMKKLRAVTELWDKIEQTGKGKYGERLANVLDEYIEEAGKAGELTDKFNESMTGVSFDNFYSSVANIVSDLESDVDDLGEHIEKTIQNAIINGFMAENYKGELEQWYNMFVENMKDGKLSESERSKLMEDWTNLSERMMNEREQLSGLFGGSSYTQDASSKGFQAMSQDVGEELNGRFTAVQIAAENSYQQLFSINSTLASMLSVKTTDSGYLLDIRNMMIDNNSYLDDMAKVTKKIYNDFSEKLDKIANNI